jgi:hypothetical protein
MSEDRMLAIRQAYVEALTAYTQALGETLQLLTLTPDDTFDPQAVVAQWHRETEALERLREMRRLYADEISDWEEETLGKTG